MRMWGMIFFVAVINLAVVEGAHLFILSGQSNMEYLDPETSFIPAVKAAFGGENVIVVKLAQRGQSIRRWYKDWAPAEGEAPGRVGDLYRELIKQVREATQWQKMESVTFVWMQGERDARTHQYCDVYAESLRGLIQQVCDDLKLSDVNVVIGRLNDFDMENRHYACWTGIRAIQVEVAGEVPFGAWVDTDDLNSGLNFEGNVVTNDIHMSEEGYKTLGSRFAKKAIELIKKRDASL